MANLPAWWAVQQHAAITLSFIGFVVVTIPLYWHLEHWNVGCIFYIFWCSTQCLIHFINMNLWRDNSDVRATTWCDIVTRFSLAAGIGISAASVVITRRLYKLTTTSKVFMTRKDKIQMIVVDLLISLTPPVLVMALSWFIQGHRFDIYEGYGCSFESPNTILSYFFLTSWPVILGCISAIYGTLTLHVLHKNRKELNELTSINDNLTFYRYMRLMGLAGGQIIYTIPLSSWTLYMQTRSPLYKWRGLGDLHYDFERIMQYPAIFWSNDPLSKSAILANLWEVIACAFIFFAFFGCAEEARKHYSMAARVVAEFVSRSTTS